MGSNGPKAPDTSPHALTRSQARRQAASAGAGNGPDASNIIAATGHGPGLSPAPTTRSSRKRPRRVSSISGISSLNGDVALDEDEHEAKGAGLDSGGPSTPSSASTPAKMTPAKMTPASAQVLLGDGRKRRPGPGTRGVANLSVEQLAKKRANDREAQRAIRERTRNQIETLQRRVTELETQLQTQGPYQEMQALIRARDAAEAENAELKHRLAAVLDILQQPLVSAKFAITRYHARDQHTQSYPHAVANPVPAFGLPSGCDTSTLTPTSSSTSPGGGGPLSRPLAQPFPQHDRHHLQQHQQHQQHQQQQSQQQQRLQKLHELQQQQWPARAQTQEHPPEHSRDHVADTRGLDSLVEASSRVGLVQVGLVQVGPTPRHDGPALHEAHHQSHPSPQPPPHQQGQQKRQRLEERHPSGSLDSAALEHPRYDALIDPRLDLLDPRLGFDVDPNLLGSNVDPSLTPSLDAVLDPRLAQPASLPARGVTPFKNCPPTCAYDGVLLDFLAERQQRVREGMSMNEVLGPSVPAFSALLGDGRPDAAPHPVSKVIADILQTFPGLATLPERVAVMYCMFHLLRWQISPTRENHDRLPSWLRPCPAQVSLPHPAWADTICFPLMREKVTRDHVASALTSGSGSKEGDERKAAVGEEITVKSDEAGPPAAAAGSIVVGGASATTSPPPSDKVAPTPFEHLFIPFTTTLSLNWPYEQADVLLPHGPHGSDDVKINPDFEHHLLRIENWTLGPAFLRAFPHLEGTFNLKQSDGRVVVC